MGSAPHLVAAEQIIDRLARPDSPVAHNIYKHPAETNLVTWGNPRWYNRSQCASFQTALLKHTYAWATDAFYLEHFRSVSPNSRTYRHRLATAEIPNFTRIPAVSALLPGDLIAIDYVNRAHSNTGHIVLVREVKTTCPTGNFPGETQYAVEVADCTADPHGTYGDDGYAAFPDNRLPDARTKRQGVGYGHMMFYADDLTGEFSRYRWSVTSSPAKTYPVSDRPIVAVRVGGTSP